MGLQSTPGPEPETFSPNPSSPLLPSNPLFSTFKGEGLKGKGFSRMACSCGSEAPLGRQDCQGTDKLGGICGAPLVLRAFAAFVPNPKPCGKKTQNHAKEERKHTSGQGASSPGAPWSPLSPLGPLEPFFPLSPCKQWFSPR